MKYRVLAEQLAVCRLAAADRVPAWALQGGFFCLARTPDEFSIVCPEACVPGGVQTELGWLALKLEGPFPFSMTGVLASFLQPLAEAQIPIFAISTFDTDYVLIKHEFVERACDALATAGHQRIDTAAS